MTPLVLIAGFLGAGKTTLLRALLPRLRGAGIVPHVVLNDYRNADVDAATLEGDRDLITPIAGTCICCGSQEELMRALIDAPLSARSIMLLEANGTADTAEIIELLTVDRRLGRYTRPIQITVIDASRWQMRGAHDALERIQVQTGRYLYPTRLEGVEGPRRQHVLESVAELAPRSLHLDLDELVRELEELVAGAPELPPRRFDRAHTAEGGARPTGHDHKSGHRERHHFSSVEIPIEGRVEEADFRALLRSLPEEVVRVKGIAWLEGSFYPTYFERTDRADSVALTPIRQRGSFDSVAVLIGVGLDAPALEAAFRALG